MDSARFVASLLLLASRISFLNAILPNVDAFDSTAFIPNRRVHFPLESPTRDWTLDGFDSFDSFETRLVLCTVFEKTL